MPILARPLADATTHRENDMARKSQSRKPAKRRAAPARSGGPTTTGAKVPRAHGRFDHSPIIDRPKLTWPNGARVALWVIPNIEHFLFDRPAARISGGPVAPSPGVRNHSSSGGHTS